MSHTLPLSEKITEYDGGEYWITAGLWRSIAGFGHSYEIGIRLKTTGEFKLLQSNHYNHQTVQEVANVIAMLLADKTQCYTPEWCARFLCP